MVGKRNPSRPLARRKVPLEHLVGGPGTENRFRLLEVIHRELLVALPQHSTATLPINFLSTCK